MQSYAKSQATVAAFSALLPEVAQGDYAEELDARLSNCYDALMTAAPPLITSINDDHQYNNDSNNKDLMEQEFHNKLVEWVTNSPDDADYKAMVYETLNDIASLVDDFVCHIDMNPSQGQCIDHLLDNRSNFVMAFARISHFLRALEVINRSRSLVRRITGRSNLPSDRHLSFAGIIASMGVCEMPAVRHPQLTCAGRPPVLEWRRRPLRVSTFFGFA